MSLVGTRPPTAGEYAQYSPHHKRRLSLKPGITGMWQVSGRSDITDFEEVVKLDLKYIDGWSFLLDIKILIMTVASVVTGKGSELEMAKMVAEKCAENKINVLIKIEDEKKFGYAPTLKMNLDTSKLRELGWKPKRGLESMFSLMIEDMQGK